MYYYGDQEEEYWDEPCVTPSANRPVQCSETPKNDIANRRSYQDSHQKKPDNKTRNTRENNGNQNNFNRNSGRRVDRNSNNGQYQRNNNGFNSDNRNPRNRNRTENGEATTMKIPTRFVGKVIGRGGSKITQLQSESGARIIITENTENDDTVVKLIGSKENVSKAKSLINEITVDPIRIIDSSNTEEYEKYLRENPKPVYEQIDWKARFLESERKNREKFAKLGPIIKNFYKEHREVSEMTDEEVQSFLERNNNIVADRTFKTDSSKPVPKPCVKFEHAFHNFPEILDEIRRAGFEKPSPIQSQAWPVLLSGEDLIGIAQTGTGKTLAFLLPALIHIDGQLKRGEKRDGPKVLVMAPTRELALQIDKEVKKYHYKGIKAVCIYGGGDRREQVKVVTEGVDIIIATPGRLNDLVAAGHVNLESLTYAVLDEADRMLDMGFEPQIRKIMYSINPCRQTVMTSATWPHGVRKLAESYMEDPIQVYVGSLDLAATHTVTQTILLVEEDDKFDMFLEFAKNLGPNDKAIVFCGKKARADHIASDLALQGIPNQTLHGDREQCDREQAIEDIMDGTIQILIATDVASRGLDINDITYVLNYDFPKNIEEYVHRVGRTGRAGKYGESISYFTKSDWAQAKELIDIMEEAQQYIPDELFDMADRFEKKKKQRESSGSSSRGGRFQLGGRRW